MVGTREYMGSERRGDVNGEDICAILEIRKYCQKKKSSSKKRRLIKSYELVTKRAEAGVGRLRASSPEVLNSRYEKGAFGSLSTTGRRNSKTWILTCFNLNKFSPVIILGTSAGSNLK